MRSKLANVRCFGTDGETALIDACKQVFPSSLCFIHVQRNISTKIHELRIMILDDIFGKSVGSHHTEGLVDAISEAMFDNHLDVMSKKWTMQDLSENGPLHTFTRWFKRYKYDIMVKSLLHPVCEQAGLGCPPEHFTTNASESVSGSQT